MFVVKGSTVTKCKALPFDDPTPEVDPEEDIIKPKKKYKTKNKDKEPTDARLNSLEAKVLELSNEGYTPQQIADTVGKTASYIHTVKWHIKRKGFFLPKSTNVKPLEIQPRSKPLPPARPNLVHERLIPEEDEEAGADEVAAHNRAMFDTNDDDAA